MEIYNIVLGAKLRPARKDIAAALTGHGEVEEMRNGGLKFKPSGSGCTFSIKCGPDTCSVHCTGSPDMGEAEGALEELSALLGELVKGPEVLNMVLKGRLDDRAPDLDFIHTFLGDSSYTPDVFPALCWRCVAGGESGDPRYLGTCKLYPNGTVLILGVRSMEVGEEVLKRLKDALEEIP